MAEYITVMYAGCIVEQGTVEEIFASPCHPYTHALLKAVPNMENENKSELQIITGTPPDLVMPPKGCGFAGSVNAQHEFMRETPDFTRYQKAIRPYAAHHPWKKYLE